MSHVTQNTPRAAPGLASVPPAQGQAALSTAVSQAPFQELLTTSILGGLCGLSSERNTRPPRLHNTPVLRQIIIRRLSKTAFPRAAEGLLHLERWEAAEGRVLLSHAPRSIFNPFPSLHNGCDASVHLGEEKLSITLKCEASSLEFNLHRYRGNYHVSAEKRNSDSGEKLFDKLYQALLSP